jgi:hypothetical protein
LFESHKGADAGGRLETRKGEGEERERERREREREGERERDRRTGADGDGRIDTSLVLPWPVVERLWPDSVKVNGGV